jgi:hypothetical protein
MVFGILILLGGVLWFTHSFQRHAGSDATDPTPWAFRGSPVMFLFDFAYGLKDPKNFGRPALLEAIGLLLLLVSLFLPLPGTERLWSPAETGLAPLPAPRADGANLVPPQCDRRGGSPAPASCSRRSHANTSLICQSSR